MLRISAYATSDILDGFDWYDVRAAGLGKEFLDEINSLIARIETSPRRYPHACHGLRKASIHRFPYSVYFRSGDDDIMIVAVLHHRRDTSVLSDRD